MIRKSYWFFENTLTPQEIVDLHKTIKENPTGQTDTGANVKKTAKVKLVNWKDFKSQFAILEQNVIIANHQNFGFHLYPFDDAFTLNINTYASRDKAEYAWHNDMGSRSPASDQKLTAIINISQEPYTGGELFLSNSEPQEVTHLNKPGSMIIFPCYMTHKVMPVTKGNRTTLSFWVLGNNFS
jgi:predicted 2-oxoglutarate/Fe(II)-dependent dioxygenase YbiX